MLVRTLSEKDRRQMCFTLTEKAVLCLTEMKKQGIEIPERLLPLFADMEKKLTAMKRKNLNWKFPGEPNRVLLHTCCAPCSSAIIECMMQHIFSRLFIIANPNIYPHEEYLIKTNAHAMPDR